MRIIRILLEMLLDSLMSIDMSSRRQRRLTLASGSVHVAGSHGNKKFEMPLTLREIRYDAELLRSSQDRSAQEKAISTSEAYS